MKRSNFHRTMTVVVLGAFVGLAGCSPKIGSDAWCEDLKEKDKGDWTANEAGDYAKHCVFKQD